MYSVDILIVKFTSFHRVYRFKECLTCQNVVGIELIILKYLGTLLVVKQLMFDVKSEIQSLI